MLLPEYVTSGTVTGMERIMLFFERKPAELDFLFLYFK